MTYGLLESLEKELFRKGNMDSESTVIYKLFKYFLTFLKFQTEYQIPRYIIILTI